MTVYVVFDDYEFEGCSQPYFVFMKKEDAQAYCDRSVNVFCTVKFKEIEINE